MQTNFTLLIDVSQNKTRGVISKWTKSLTQVGIELNKSDFVFKMLKKTNIDFFRFLFLKLVNTPPSFPSRRS